MLINPRMLVIGLLMVAGAGLALAMKPTQRIADAGARVDLEKMIPQQIGEWRVDPSVIPIEPSPEEKAFLQKVYSETLSRTYVNDAGQRIMLSIAYSAAQSDLGMNIHRPEVCYTAQGFGIEKEAVGTLDTQARVLPVKRLLAIRDDRSEPITYWLVVGDQATRFGLEQKLAQLRYGLTGKIPDGFLIRVSSIGRDLPEAYRRQEAFVKTMLGAMGRADRARLVGSLGNG